MIQDIISKKGSVVHIIAPGTMLDLVARTLVERRIGSLLVARQGPSGEQELLGIVTERDILYHCAKSNLPLAAVEVTTVMSSPLITAAPGDSIDKVMGLMTDKRIRHIPVLAEGRLIGLVSIGDLVKAQHDNLAMENRFMKDYIRS
ncbi:MAG: CBS domain-containing protein [Thermoguttaceae bacterium]